MKRIIFFLTLVIFSYLSFAQTAYNIPDVGNIYYKIVDNTAIIVHPSTSSAWDGYERPSGDLSIPESIDDYPVVAIGDSAFYECEDISSIVLPNTITSIGQMAFYYCSGLTSVSFSNSLTVIKDAAFYGTGLNSVTLPSSLPVVGNGVFDHCANLTSVSIPNTVTTIGRYAFSACRRLTSFTIPDSVASIGDYAFTNCSALTSVSFNDVVTSIGEGAFSNCSVLKSVSLPNSVTSIGDYAFNYCGSLSSVVIPNSVMSIGEYAFEGCTALTSLTFDPPLNNGDNSLSLGVYAFKGCSALHSLILPSSLTSISEGAFFDCIGLDTIAIPGSVTSISAGAFNNCFNLNLCFLGNLAQWCSIERDYIEWTIDSLYILNQLTTEVVVPDTLQTIASCSFKGCVGLSSVITSGILTTIDERAFEDCSALSSAVIGNSVVDIRRSAFANCTNLNSISIGKSVEYIESYAFYKCPFTSITLPFSLKSIGGYSLSCPNLSEIHSLARETPFLDYQVFCEVPSDIPVYVPCGCLEAYQSRWSYFSNLLESDAPSFSAVSDDDVKGTVQVETQPSCAAPLARVMAIANEGYRFDHWSDGCTYNPYSLNVYEDTALVAYFVKSSEGVDNVLAEGCSILATPNGITVTGACNQCVTLFDAMGRPLSIQPRCPQAFTFAVPNTGVYFVQVGNSKARRVVKLR